MAELQLTPERHPVFNEFDNFGLLLGLPRLEGESNRDYKIRLFDVFVNRASSTYRGLINGITRELGLSISKTLVIRPVLNHVGEPHGKNVAVKFEGTKCNIYTDIKDKKNGLLKSLDRFEVDKDAYTLKELANSINATGIFTASFYSGIDDSTRSMTIFDQSSIKLVTSEDIAVSGSRVKLKNSNLISDSVVVISPNLRSRVELESDLKHTGQYFINYKQGYIQGTDSPGPGSLIRYRYRDDNFVVYSSPVIIHNMQSADFRTKMFEQINRDDGTADGAPTALGADLINELMSVYPALYAK